MTDFERELFHDLFFEQENEVLGSCYRHGLFRSVAVLVRTLFMSQTRCTPLESDIRPCSCVGVVFFPNELRALTEAPEAVRPDCIVMLNPHSLSVIREVLGVRRLLQEVWHFLQLTLREKGVRYFRRLTYPLLGWLLFHAVGKVLTDGPQVTIVTTNMQHPLSIGVARAAVTQGCPTDFYEHSTTPRLVLRDRGYRRLFVRSEHTKHMMTEGGIEPDRIKVMAPSVTPIQPAEFGSPIGRAALCINGLDALQSIIDVTDVLDELGIAFTYRVHDADWRRNRLARMAQRADADFSDARHSTIDEFLGTVDLVIAGNSNVIADAVDAGKRVIYYWDGKKDLFDYYGLVRYHSIPWANSRESLRAILLGTPGRPADILGRGRSRDLK